MATAWRAAGGLAHTVYYVSALGTPASGRKRLLDGLEIDEVRGLANPRVHHSPLLVNHHHAAIRRLPAKPADSECMHLIVSSTNRSNVPTYFSATALDVSDSSA